MMNRSPAYSGCPQCEAPPPQRGGQPGTIRDSCPSRPLISQTHARTAPRGPGRRWTGERRTVAAEPTHTGGGHAEGIVRYQPYGRFSGIAAGNFFQPFTVHLAMSDLLAGSGLPDFALSFSAGAMPGSVGLLERGRPFLVRGDGCGGAWRRWRAAIRQTHGAPVIRYMAADPRSDCHLLHCARLSWARIRATRCLRGTALSGWRGGPARSGANR